MKKIILFLIIALNYSCQKTSEDYEKILKEKIEKESKMGKKTGSIFLGYYFGMPKEDVWVHTLNLIEKGKLYEDTTGKIRFNYSNVQVPYVIFDFHNDKLYKISLFFPDALDFFNVKSDYRLKYGDPVIPDLKEADISEQWIWIEKNLQITAGNDPGYVSDVEIVSYTDLSIEKEVVHHKNELDRKKEIQDSLKSSQAQKEI